MVILAIDPGVFSGWATNKHGTIESGVEEFPKERGSSEGMRYINFNKWIHEILDLIQPDIVAIEKSFTFKSGQAADIQSGFRTRIYEACTKKDIDYFSVPPPTLKKFFTGNGRASKEDMIKKASEKFNKEIEDDNEADALALLNYAEERYRG